MIDVPAQEIISLSVSYCYDLNTKEWKMHWNASQEMMGAPILQWLCPASLEKTRSLSDPWSHHL